MEGTAFGGARGRTDVSRIVDWYMEGRINIDDLISHTLPLEQITEGFGLMRRGESIRTVLTYQGNLAMSTSFLISVCHEGDCRAGSTDTFSNRPVCQASRRRRHPEATDPVRMAGTRSGWYVEGQQGSACDGASAR